MKLLIVSPQPEHPPMDAFRVFRALGDELSRRGHTVDYFIEPGKIKRPRATANGHSPFSDPALTGALRRGLQLATRLSGTCRKRDYDFLLTAASLGWCLSMFRQWLLPTHTKIISWYGGHRTLQSSPIEGENAIEAPQSPPANWRNKLAQWTGKKALETQDGHFFNTTEAPLRVLEGHPQAAQQKLIYLPNGVANHYYFPQRHQPPHAAGSPSRLLTVGPWVDENVKLVASFCRLYEAHPHLRLSVAKPGISKEAVLASFPQPIRSAILVLPELGEAELVAAYQQHDIYLQPVPTEGGVPLSLLEAMAAAMPVVADEAPGVIDVLKHYENGLLIPPQDGNALEQSITHLLENPDLYRNLGENAYDYVSRYYTWRQVSDIFEEKLFQIMQDRLVTPGVPG